MGHFILQKLPCATKNKEFAVSLGWNTFQISIKFIWSTAQFNSVSSQYSFSAGFIWDDLCRLENVVLASDIIIFWGLVWTSCPFLFLLWKPESQIFVHIYLQFSNWKVVSFLNMQWPSLSSLSSFDLTSE